MGIEAILIETHGDERVIRLGSGSSQIWTGYIDIDDPRVSQFGSKLRNGDISINNILKSFPNDFVIYKIKGFAANGKAVTLKEYTKSCRNFYCIFKKKGRTKSLLIVSNKKFHQVELVGMERPDKRNFYERRSRAPFLITRLNGKIIPIL